MSADLRTPGAALEISSLTKYFGGKPAGGGFKGKPAGGKPGFKKARRFD